MKIIKKILKWIGILILLLILVSFFLPSRSHVERSIVMNASTEIAFAQVNTLKNWEKWSPWHHIDTAMQLSYDGPESGPNAKYNWKSENPNVGEGSLTFVSVVPNDSIHCKMEFTGMGISYSSYKFRKEENGTKVTWAMDGDGEGMPWYWKVPSKYMCLFMDKMVGPDFEKGLNSMKEVAEKAATETPATKTELVIEATTTTAQTIASYRMMTSEKTISGDIGNSYARIGMFMKKNKLNQNGAVLAIYHSYDATKIDMECAVQLDKTAKGEGEIKVSEMKAGNAVVAHYYGAYEKTNTAHDALHKWIGDNKKKIIGDPWEVYVTDPMNEKDTAKWLTEIYYPVE